MRAAGCAAAAGARRRAGRCAGRLRPRRLRGQQRRCASGLPALEQLGELQGVRAEMVHKPGQQPGIWCSKGKGYCARALAFTLRCNLILLSRLQVQLYLKLAFRSHHPALLLSRLLHLDPSFRIS
ncbi:hypothetical protein D3C81_1666000 [compost metagenome]